MQVDGDRPLRVFHLGGYWRAANDTVRHMMEGLRQADAEVHEYCTDDHRDALDTDGRRYDRGTSGPVWLRWPVVGPEIEAFDPDLVVCNAGGLAFRPDDAARLRRSRRLLGVALSDPAVFDGTTRHIAHLFDLFLTNHPPTVRAYEAVGATADVLPFGTNPDFFHPASPDPAMACDVLVMGHAHRDRIEPVRALREHFDVHVYGERWDEHGIPSRGIVFGEESLVALASAACVVVFHLDKQGRSLIKPSLFDFTAAGALVVTNRDPAIEPYFEYGRELVGFRTHGELVAAVREILDDPDRARAIRTAGRARTLRDHTWARSWETVLSRHQHTLAPTPRRGVTARLRDWWHSRRLPR